jgi:hypothetical protein
VWFSVSSVICFDVHWYKTTIDITGIQSIFVTTALLHITQYEN